jgi:hypothetical protein
MREKGGVRGDGWKKKKKKKTCRLVIKNDKTLE